MWMMNEKCGVYVLVSLCHQNELEEREERKESEELGSKGW